MSGTRDSNCDKLLWWKKVVYVCMVLPVVGGVECYSVSLPGDVGLRYSIDLTLEASNTSLIHRHGHWVGVELRKR